MKIAELALENSSRKLRGPRLGVRAAAPTFTNAAIFGSTPTRHQYNRYLDVLSRTLSAPFSVAVAPLFTTRLLVFFTLWPACLAVFAVAEPVDRKSVV